MRYLLILALALVACSPFDAPEGEPGPVGERGPRGAPGPACAPPTTYVVTASGPAGSVVAECEAGDALTGGYCQVALTGVELVQAGPVDEEAWWCFAAGDPGPGVTAAVYAYAICLER